MSGLAPKLTFDACDATDEQLRILDERFIGLLVHTDMLVAQGYDVTADLKNALVRVVMHLRSLRHELQALKVQYRALHSGARVLPS